MKAIAITKKQAPEAVRYEVDGTEIGEVYGVEKQFAGWFGFESRGGWCLLDKFREAVEFVEGNIEEYYTSKGIEVEFIK